MRGGTVPAFLTVCLVLIAASSDLHVVSGVQGPAGAKVNQTIVPVSLTQPAQVSVFLKISYEHRISHQVCVKGVCVGGYFWNISPVMMKECSRYNILSFLFFCFLIPQIHPKPGVISSGGGMTLSKGGMQLHVLGTNVTQIPAPQPPAPLQPQVSEELYLYGHPFTMRNSWVRCWPTSQTLRFGHV